MPLKWFGPKVAAKAVGACKTGVDKTMAECVDTAKTDHPWQNVTGTAEASIRIVEEAELDGRLVKGQWGSASVAYAIYLELGTVHMEPRPFLRPAADKNYPHLKRHVAEAYAAESVL